VSGEWQLVFDEVPFRLFLSRRLSERRILLSAFESLKADPYQQTDFDIEDASQRQLSIRAFRPFLITYWLDASVKRGARHRHRANCSWVRILVSAFQGFSILAFPNV
jgi:hypothetical protein